MSRIPPDPDKVAAKRADLNKLASQIIKSLEGADSPTHVKVVSAVVGSMLDQGNTDAFFGVAVNPQEPEWAMVLFFNMGKNAALIGDRMKLFIDDLERDGLMVRSRRDRGEIPPELQEPDPDDGGA